MKLSGRNQRGPRKATGACNLQLSVADFCEAGISGDLALKFQIAGGDIDGQRTCGGEVGGDYVFARLIEQIGFGLVQENTVAGDAVASAGELQLVRIAGGRVIGKRLIATDFGKHEHITGVRQSVVTPVGIPIDVIRPVLADITGPCERGGERADFETFGMGTDERGGRPQFAEAAIFSEAASACSPNRGGIVWLRKQTGSFFDPFAKRHLGEDS